MVFSLNTPLPSVEDSICSIEASIVDCGTDRAGADTDNCESKSSHGADSYNATTGGGLVRRSIKGSAYVLT